MLTACPECDLLLQGQRLSGARHAMCCPRCGALLSKRDQGSLEHSLALACAALILLLIGNLYPIVGLNIQGQHVETTLFGAVRQLWQDEMAIVAALVFVTTILVPLLELLALIWVLLPLHLGREPIAFVHVFNVLRLTHPWGMVEVFILGVLVALVKLSHMAEVLPGLAIWCFGLLMLVMTALSAILNQRSIWDGWDRSRA